jgi:hypothetical protein
MDLIHEYKQWTRLQLLQLSALLLLFLLEKLHCCSYRELQWLLRLPPEAAVSAGGAAVASSSRLVALFVAALAANQPCHLHAPIKLLLKLLLMAEELCWRSCCWC